MRHWLQVGIRNWRVKPGRTAGAIGAIALGVGVVVWVTTAYESVRLSLREQVWFWIGRSHLSVESIYGSAGTVYESLAKQAGALPNVRQITCRLQRLMVLHPLSTPPGTTQAVERPGQQVEAVGIDPTTEYLFREYAGDLVGKDSRMLTPQDTDAVVIEHELAARCRLKIGDPLVLRSIPPLGSEYPARSGTFTIVGLIEHRRATKDQFPIVMARLDRIQELTRLGADAPRVTKIDVLLDDTATKPMRDTEQALRRIVENFHVPGYQGDFAVTSSEGKLRQVENAEKQTANILALLSSVALFTGFFIILSTLSMGMVERIGQLGLLRCLGATRYQIASLVFCEAVPIGFVGILLGIPIGLGLAVLSVKLSVKLAPEYIGRLAVSGSGILLAVLGGGLTTLAGAALPVVQAMRVSPLAASRPQSQPAPGLITWLAALVGLAMIGASTYIIRFLPLPRHILNPAYPIVVVMLLYGGYALITPALIRIIGQAAVFVAAVALRIRHRLLSDQVGRAAWRSAIIASGLMVGLSLIVTLVVHGKSMSAGWNFPRDFAEAFVYLNPPIPVNRARELQRLPGLASSCLVNEQLRCTIYGKGIFHFPWSTYVVGDPDGFFSMAKLEFVAGNQEDAIAKLKKGGYVLVTPDFVRNQKVGYGEKVTIRLNSIRRPPAQFEIAGVVTSPALEIAANYFNAGGMLTQQAVHVALGTFADARRVFGVSEAASMFLINFDLKAAPPPPEFEADSPPAIDTAAGFAAMIESWRPALPERVVELDEIRQQAGETGTGSLRFSDIPLLGVFDQSLRAGPAAEWSKLNPAQRWQSFREELLMQLIAARGGSSTPIHASVRALKDQIDRDLEKATLLLASVPMVALIVAALGVGNLMMANVTSRARQIAMLRAIGATKWQIVRLVAGEALVLGCVGAALGVLLGFHAAKGLNSITEGIWGYQPAWNVPWNWVGLAVAFTLSVCLIAGILPARHASRSNILDALQTT